ncbi:MAG: hypothetical protein PHX20_00645 [Candidatus Omnitrophica bacterium]|nr:hypothetical protein [Candidatus Omnitrophota bacterium]MDD5436042.1 hypothetical protein [Candidatus Omnitrophota bacterium]
MILKIPAILIAVISILAACAQQASSSGGVHRLVEDRKLIMGTEIRIQIPVASDDEEALAHRAIDKAVKAASADGASVSIGLAIDKEVSALKECGIANAFVNSAAEMYSLGMKTDEEMWKAWIPHLTDKGKVLAFLRLKNEAIATVSDNTGSASVVADTAGDAERLAKELLAQGADGLKTAEALGLDALLVMKDGNKLKTGLSGGFKEQYGNKKN